MGDEDTVGLRFNDQSDETEALTATTSEMRSLAIGEALCDRQSERRPACGRLPVPGRAVRMRNCLI